MHSNGRPRISIWFYIGGLLTVYGVLITGAGVAELRHPPPVALAGLHAGIWWGAAVLAVGVAYVASFWPSR